jgi:hypothetical protein
MKQKQPNCTAYQLSSDLEEIRFAVRTTATNPPVFGSMQPPPLLTGCSSLTPPSA